VPEELGLSDALQNLIEVIESRIIVCLLPSPCDKLVNVIKSAKKLMAHPVEKDPTVRVDNPSILAGWGSSDETKWNRFK